MLPLTKIWLQRIQLRVRIDTKVYELESIRAREDGTRLSGALAELGLVSFASYGVVCSLRVSSVVGIPLATSSPTR